MSFRDLLKHRYLDEAGEGGDGAGGGEGGGAADQPWYAGASESVQALIGERKWDSIDAMASSYQNLEKLKGVPEAELMRLPKAGDAEGWTAAMRKLGLPESADGYEGLDFGEKASQQFMEWAKGAFHKAGLPPAAAKALAQEWNQYTESQMKELNDSLAMKQSEQQAALEKEWGAGYDNQVRAAKSAVREFGISEEMVNTLEESLGFDGVMKLFANIGSKLGEDRFSDGGSGHQGDIGGGMTPAQAQQKWSDLMMDKEFTNALMSKTHPGHAAAVERKSQLMSFMHPQG